MLLYHSNSTPMPVLKLSFPSLLNTVVSTLLTATLQFCSVKSVVTANEHGRPSQDQNEPTPQPSLSLSKIVYENVATDSGFGK